MMYEAVIGIEVHCELKTKSKMFSMAPVTFGCPPNTQVHVIDMAMPGTLPAVNKKAVEMAIRVCHALHMDIDDLLRFDRKNYYYADLHKGFQITEYYHPIGKNGYLDIEVEGETFKIPIGRVHLEEDTAKMTHNDHYTLIDYNRAGIPLIEIVTKPQLHTSQQVVAYLEALRLILIYTDVSDAVMAEGSMRCDVNISLRQSHDSTLGEKAEIKNLNSLANIQKAIDYEIERQTDLLQKKLPIARQTRRFDEKTQTTVVMREKQSLLDYRYYPEVNILPVRLDKQWIQVIQKQLPQLPEQRRQRYQMQYHLSLQDTMMLLSHIDLSDFYDQVVSIYPHYQTICHWLIGDVRAYLRQYQKKVSELLLVQDFAELMHMLEMKKISSKQTKQILEFMILEKKSPYVLMERYHIQQVSDEQLLSQYIEEVLHDYPQQVADYYAGKHQICSFFVGQVMKKTKGQANPQKTNELLKCLLEKRKV